MGKTCIIERFMYDVFDEKPHVIKLLTTFRNAVITIIIFVSTQYSQLSESISWLKPSILMKRVSVFNFGILQDKKDSEVSFLVIFEMLLVQSSFLMLQVKLQIQFLNIHSKRLHCWAYKHQENC